MLDVYQSFFNYLHFGSQFWERKQKTEGNFPFHGIWGQVIYMKGGVGGTEKVDAKN